MTTTGDAQQKDNAKLKTTRNRKSKRTWAGCARDCAARTMKRSEKFWTSCAATS